MMKKKGWICLMALWGMTLGSEAQVRMSEGIEEHFGKGAPEQFVLTHWGRKAEEDSRYKLEGMSSVEEGTRVMKLCIAPEDPAGAGKGPEIVSKEYTHFGTYSARIKVPDVREVQPNVGAVVGYFTYNMEREAGLSEIDWEWLIADPRLVYIGTWTGADDNHLQRVGRVINLSTGEILATSYRSAADGNQNHRLTGAQSMPQRVPAIPDYDASKRFYTYGFDWQEDRIVWWILHPETQERIVLWDYAGSTPLFTGIPTHKTKYRLNFWHTNNWPVDTNPQSVEKPERPYEVEVEWMKYEGNKQIEN